MLLRIVLRFCIGTLAFISSTPVWCAEAPFSIMITAAPEVVKSGSEVRIDIVYTNVSDHEIELVWVYGAVGEFFNRVEIQDDRGLAVASTKYGHDLPGRDVAPRGPGPYYVSRGSMGSLWFKRMPPGKTLQDAIILTKLHDLSRSGRYTVQVERFDETTKTFVKSNKIAITVTE
jgi:hypothetical protein